MNTLWNETYSIPRRKHLPGNLSSDIAVIGAGMAGILTAFYLAREGRQVIVAEAARITGGQTAGTTAKITSQHGLIYQRLVKNIGAGAARLYASANENALSEYQRLIRDRDISCEFERLPAYLYSCRSSLAIQDEAEAARLAKIPASLTGRTELPFSVKAAVRFPDQAQFHPLRFLGALVPSLVIYENTPVLSVTEDGSWQILSTPHGRIRAKEVVFACHYPFPLIPGFYFMKMYQKRSYVLSLTGAPKLKGMYLGIDPDGLSLRSAGDRLLLGGAGHRTGKLKGQPYQSLRRSASRFFPGSKTAGYWSAQDCVSLDGLPYIGRFSPRTPHWYIASGFGKWGMSTSMAAALLLTDLICGRTSPYEALFSPHRLHIRASAGEFAVHSAESARGLLLGASPSSMRCPHMGCKLNWNCAENTWECPCHGSRFDSQGHLLNGPAQTSL